MPFPYTCPYCKHTVQIANPLPVGRPVKCPGCKKLYTAGAPGSVGTGPTVAPASVPAGGTATPTPAMEGQPNPTRFARFVSHVGTMELKIVLACCFFLFMLAVVPSIIAANESAVSSTATSEPLLVDLAKLEKGDFPSNTHVKIGVHDACYFATIYSYTTRGQLRKKPDVNTKLDYSFYPIISGSHPYNKQIEKLQAKYGNLEKLPENIEWPELTNFRVLVRTTRFRKVGDIPDDDLRKESGVQGLIINRISTLDSKERDLIKEDFPQVDFSKVIILDEGRRPSSGFFTFFLTCVSLPFWFATFGLFGIWVFSRVMKRA